MACGGCESTEKDFEGETAQHPCYNPGAHDFARMHIPVAPRCNISCNYCNRKFDCLNESRPGVTSEVLTPEEAFDKFIDVKNKMDNLKVVGIAGPGDALANIDNTRKAIKLIQSADDKVIICLSTNGLMIPEYFNRIMKLNVNHITITINTIRPEIGAKIYRYIYYNGERHYGEEGAKILIDNQLKGLKMLADAGVMCKVNIVMIKGVNDEYIEETVQKVKELGAVLTNIMPLIPAKGSKFENMPLVSTHELNTMRLKCGTHLKQMYHCQQCRADAIGKLKEDRSIEFRNNKTIASEAKRIDDEKIRVAVSSKTGSIIDEHFGHSKEFYIYDYENNGLKFLECRKVEKYCNGPECSGESKIESIINTLSDCKMVLSMRIGYEPKKKLMNSNIIPIETYDKVQEGILEALKSVI